MNFFKNNLIKKLKQMKKESEDSFFMYDSEENFNKGFASAINKILELIEKEELEND